MAKSLHAIDLAAHILMSPFLDILYRKYGQKVKKLYRWSNCFFVVFEGIGSRFVSIKLWPSTIKLGTILNIAFKEVTEIEAKLINTTPETLYRKLYINSISLFDLPFSAWECLNFWVNDCGLAWDNRGDRPLIYALEKAINNYRGDVTKFPWLQIQKNLTTQDFLWILCNLAADKENLVTEHNFTLKVLAFDLKNSVKPLILS